MVASKQIKKKRGRPPLSAARKMQRSKAAHNARVIHKTLRNKIANLKADFKEKLKIVSQEAYQKALEKVVKIERRKMEANYRALAVAKAKFGKSFSKISQRVVRAKPSTKSILKRSGMRKRNSVRKMP